MQVLNVLRAKGSDSHQRIPQRDPDRQIGSEIGKRAHNDVFVHISVWCNAII